MLAWPAAGWWTQWSSRRDNPGQHCMVCHQLLFSWVSAANEGGGTAGQGHVAQVVALTHPSYYTMIHVTQQHPIHSKQNIRPVLHLSQNALASEEKWFAAAAIDIGTQGDHVRGYGRLAIHAGAGE